MSDIQNFKDAADKLGIPYYEVARNVFQFGQGSKSVRMSGTLNEYDSHIGGLISGNKYNTGVALRRVGINVPLNVVTVTLEQARVAAGHIGYPLVVKPIDKDGGVGVTICQNLADLERGFGECKRVSEYPMVEKFVTGKEYRLIVFLNKLIWAVERIAPEGVAKNISQGGVPVACFDQVHPDNKMLAERIARAVGLATAGIDFIIEDISKSHLETPSYVLEVNAQQGIGLVTAAHVYPQMLSELVLGNGILEVFKAGHKRNPFKNYGIIREDGLYINEHKISNDNAYSENVFFLDQSIEAILDET